VQTSNTNMGDPSFDDLLESLDAIQAERQSTYQRRDSDPDERHGHHHHHEERQEYNLAPPQSHTTTVHMQYSPPDNSYHASRDNAPVETYSSPVQHTNHAATPSRQGDVTQYQRQTVIQPKTHHSSDTHCAKCNQSLYGTEFVTAAGKNYHQEHFVCAKCGTRLLGAYYDHHSQVYCPNCAGDLMPCSKCRRGITGHYLILEGQPFHNECVDRKRCAGCHSVIEDTVLTALGKTWHTRCFKCIQCNKELGKEFISKDGHGQCVNCADRARPACEKCRNPLSGEFINFQGQSYHQDCFVCSQCRSRLGTSGFFNVHGQLKCQRCSK